MRPMPMDEDYGDRYGLPLYRAWWRLIPEQTAYDFIICSLPYMVAPFTREAARNYSAFAARPNAPMDDVRARQNWIPDPRRNALLDAEADQQKIWRRVDTDLKARLLAGDLDGFGRQRNIVAPLVPIKRWAWSQLEVDWVKGNAKHDNLKFLDIRIRDSVGLPLSQAAIAYGPDVEAERVLVARAYGSFDLCATETGLRESLLSIVIGAPRFADAAKSRPSPSLLCAAENSLRRTLLDLLEAGQLLGFGQRDGAPCEIPRSEWQHGTPDFDRSALTTSSGTYTDVPVRLPHPFAQGAGEASRRPSRPLNELPAWWEERVSKHPHGRWPFKEEDDFADAKATGFTSEKRDTIRELRKRIAGRISSGRRKVGKPP